MKTVRWLLLATVIAIILLIIFAVLPCRNQVESSAQAVTASECPEPTDKGAYHLQGYGKDGEPVCGFTFYNECPYFAGAEAGTPECEKGKPTPEQLERWQPEETEPVQQKTKEVESTGCTSLK